MNRDALAVTPASDLSHAEDAALTRLEADGLLPQGAAARVRSAAAGGGGALVRILTGLGLIPDAELAAALAGQLDLPLCDASALQDAIQEIEGVSARFLAARGFCPLSLGEEELVVAVADPFDAAGLQALRLACGRRVSLALAPLGAIEEALSRASRTLTAPQAVRVADDLARLQDGASDAPAIRFVNAAIRRALEARASDIHVEPLPDRLRIRFRIDGVLIDQDPAPLDQAPAVLSRIKIMSGLDIAERRLPQDGGMRLAAGGREIDVRVATAPATFGEAAVLRLLDRADAALDLRALGYEGDALARLTELLDRPNGILLVTGPTGSGKSTTLYAALAQLNAPERKLVSVEDPVERKLPGVTQIQVKPEIGLTFAAVLRSVLRHDPDVLMIGEVRDGETARIAVQAALTGHLVLATLHTNGAAAALPRLRDMGLEEYLLASTIAGVLAQRLVRTLCACATPAEPTAALRAEARLLHLDADLRPRAPKGCPACSGTGFRGRTAIYELLTVNDAIRRQMMAQADAAPLHAAAVAGGMTPLYTRGLSLVLDGVTTQSEILRVARDSL